MTSKRKRYVYTFERDGRTSTGYVEAWSVREAQALIHLRYGVVLDIKIAPESPVVERR
jgi:hypothetical protein